MHDQVFLGLGSNLGDREAFLRHALRKIADFGKIKKVSSVWESAPWGKDDQPPFLNLAVEISTPLSPRNFLAKLKSIESEIGRKQRGKWEEREIDIDILFWSTQTLQTANLTVPHPFWKERDFVVIPLSEIAPEFLPPGETQNIAVMASALTNNSLRNKGRISA